MCIRVEFHHRKNGFFDLCERSMKSSAPAVISSSIVSIRFLVSGPVSSIFLRPAFDLSTPRGPKRSLNSGFFG